MEKKIFYYGLGLLLSSAVFLILSVQSFSPSSGENWSFALLMLTARLLGLGAFVLGAWLIFLQNFGRAIILIVGSIALPAASFYILGTI